MIWTKHKILLLIILIVFSLAWYENYSANKCQNTGVSKQKCFAEEINKIISSEGTEKAFDSLIAFSKQDENFAVACHSNAHEIGRVAYRNFIAGSKVQYTPKMSYCGYGFFHGFVEDLLLDTGSIDRAVEFCNSLEEKMGGSISGATRACFHGIGHGAVDASDPNSWGNAKKIIEPAMELCLRLPLENYARYLCHTGAYNSLEILSSDQKYKIKYVSDDPYSFCNTEPRSQRGGCYVNMIIAVLRLKENNIKETSDYILENITYPNDLTVDNSRVDEVVILSLFHEFVRINFGKSDIEITGINLCRQFSSNGLRLACIKGISGGYMKYYAPESSYENWFEFCGNSSLEIDERNSCFEYVLSRISLWYDSVRARSICKSVPTEYQSYCRIK